MALDWDLGGAIQYCLCRKRWTHGELARRMEVSRSYIGKLVTGQTQPMVPTLLRILAALEISGTEFFEIAAREDLGIFRDSLVREIAGKMPLKKWQRNEIIRFINRTAPRRKAA